MTCHSSQLLVLDNKSNNFFIFFNINYVLKNGTDESTLLLRNNFLTIEPLVHFVFDLFLITEPSFKTMFISHF